MEEESDRPSYKSAWKLYLFSVFAALGHASGGYASSAYNSTIDYVSLVVGWSQEEIAWRKSTSYAIFSVGTLIMQFLIFWKFSNSSRKTLLVISDFFTIVGVTLTIIPVNGAYEVGRFLYGSGYGLSGPIVPIFIRETAPACISGRMGSIASLESQFAKLLGFVLAFGLSIPPTANEFFWRVLNFVPVVFAVSRILFLMLYYRDDTPKYYVLHGRDEDAKRVLNKIYCTEDQSEQIFANIKGEHYNEKGLSIHTFLEKYRYQGTLCFILLASVHLTGQSIVPVFSTSILTSPSVSNLNLNVKHLQFAKFINVGMGLTSLLSCFSASFFLDRFGRKPLLMMGIIFTTTALFFLALGLQLKLELLAGLMIILLTVGSSIGFSMVNPIYMSEVLPAIVKNLLTLIDTMINILVSFAFPIVANIEGFGFPGVLYTMFGIGNVIIILMAEFVVETKGLTMFEIYQLFKKKSNKAKSPKDLEENETLINKPGINYILEDPA